MAPTGAASADATAALGRAALDEAAATVESLLGSPGWALDPTSPEASSAAEGARRLAKLFFDAAQDISPPGVRAAASGLASLVVDGFSREQIWEELEVQNVPLRRHLRRHVAALAKAPAGKVALVPDKLEGTPAVASEATQPSAAAAQPPKARRLGRRGAAEVPAAGESSAGEGGAGESAGDEAEAAAAPRSGRKRRGRPKRPGADADAVEEPSRDDHGAAAPEDEVDAFDEDEMHRFADLGDKGKLRLSAEADDSDFEDLEIDDDDEEDRLAKEARFSDFFDPVEAGREPRPTKKARGAKEKKRGRRRGAASDAEDEEEGEVAEVADEEEESEEVQIGGAGAEDLSDEERELEEKIKQLQQEGAGGEGSDDEGEEEEGALSDGEDDAEDGEEAEEGGKAPGRKAKSLYEMDQRLASLEEEVARLEEEQLQEKPWLMKGEVSAKQRPLNSLLEVHLDQPMTQLAARNAEYAAGGGGAPEGDDEALEDVPGAEKLAKSSKAFDVEAIIRQRIWDEAFDDVQRRAAVRPADRPQGAEDDTVETLNFEKSRVGLGDVYAKQYEAEILGAKTEGEVKEDKEKTETKALFAKLMHKLDLLTNAHFTPRPPTLGLSGEQLSKVPSLKMEETIPLLISDATLKAPEELKAPRRHERDHEELNHEEKAAVRRAKKAKRRKRLDGKLETGDMTLSGMRERDKKLAEKNASVKKEKAAKFVAKEGKKKLRSADLLSQAADNAMGDASRKEARRQPQERPEGAPSSKRLKL